jgi:hypothetical protein
LHGFSGNHGTFMRTAAVDAAEEGGYILVGVMGYSPSGSFGMPFGGRGPSRGPAVAPAAGRGGRGAPIGGTAETEPAKVAELSEKDALYVLEMVRKEFNVDDRRIYLMGTRWAVAAHCTWARSTRESGPRLLHWRRRHLASNGPAHLENSG